MEKETPEENLNQACVRVLKEMGKETPECCTDTCGKERPNWLGRIPITPDPETPEHDKYNCEECRENMREYTKETPTEDSVHDPIIRDKSGQSIGIDRSKYPTPTEECPDCKCTNLVSDQCKGECLCHHPELTQTEEWEKEFEAEFIVSYFMSDGAKNAVKSFIRSLLSSHDAELRRKIEGIAEDHYWDSLESQKDLVLLHLRAVLDLLTKK